ncbi:MAG: hypothetical protein IIB95_09190 [Candidatus Marinimicrobia bacterium]|nr:hypothetical protein [Candidatus Neomarinimicrobiota bacterium]
MGWLTVSACLPAFGGLAGLWRARRLSAGATAQAGRYVGGVTACPPVIWRGYWLKKWKTG